jgi:hypothetical protein
MPLYRDSKNPFDVTFTNSGSVVDISAYDFRLELYQNGTCVSLTMDDGLSFTTDGTDGGLSILISKDRINQFCSGVVRIRLFDDSGDDPLLVGEGTETVEGKKFDA